MPETRPTLVLIHGGRHGGWSWRRLAPRLRAAGLHTLAPSLTGMAERRHLLTREVDLETHTLDIATLLEFENLRGVVLVAHSYGGMVATAVADRMPERVAGVVFLDGFTAQEGFSVLDTLSEEQAEAMRRLVRARGDGWRVPAEPGLLRSYGVTDPADLAWAEPLVTDQPWATYTQPLTLTGAIDGVPRAYVRFTRGTVVPAPVAEFARASGAVYRELDVGHDAIISDPGTVEASVLELLGELTAPAAAGD